MIGEISALASSLAIAGSAVLSKSLLGKITPLPLQTMRCWFGTIFLVAGCFILGKTTELAHVPWLPTGLTVLSAFIGIAVGDTLYLKTLSLAEVSKAFPVVRGIQILTATLIAILLLDEQVTWTFGIGAILILGGVYLAAFTRAEAKPNPGVRSAGQRTWLLLAATVGICWALSWCIMKVVLRDVDPLIANTLRVPVAALMLTFLAFGSGQRESLSLSRHGLIFSGLIIVSGILSYTIGVLLALYAIHFAGVSRTAVLTSVTPLFVLGLSVLFLRERLTPRLSLGTLLCAGGIAIIVIA